MNTTLKHVLCCCAALLFLCAIASAQPSITPSCPGSTPAGNAVSAGFSLNGVDGPYQWMLVNAPSGFSIQDNGTSITVVGNAPNSAGTYPITVAAIIYSGQSSTQYTTITSTCRVSVQSYTPGVQIMGSCPTTPYTPGASIQIPLTAQGGSGYYSWHIDSTLGLKLSSTSGTGVIVQGAAGYSSGTFTVTLSDAGGSDYPSTTATFTCTINVTVPSLTITGTCPSGPVATGSAISIPLTAAGGSGTFAWQISGNSGLTLSSTSGSSVTLQGTAPAAGQYNFTVTLSDPLGRGSTSFTCSITVVVPLSVTGTCPAQPIVTGTAFSLPLSVSGGTGPYTWTVSGPFTPSSTTGSSITLSGTPTTPGNVTIGVTVKDSSGIPAGTFNCSIRVVAPLTITGPPCPITNIVQGKAFSVPLTAAGGTGNYKWTITGPSFINLSATSGTSVSLTGVSTNAGNFAFSVSLTDDANTPLSTPFSCSLQVTPTLTLSGTVPDAVLSQPYPATQLVATGGAPPLTFSVTAGGLPPGLQLASATGIISGTPTEVGTFQFTATVTDSGTGTAQQSVSAAFQITVAPLLVSTTACPLPTGRELQSYNAPLTATGGNGQFTFSLAGTTLLPPGLVLSQNAITGTPQGPSNTTLSLQITSGTQTVTVSCALNVLGRIPVVTVNGFFNSVGSPLATSSISLDAPVQQDVTGTAVLSFTPDVPNSAVKDNPQVQFCGGNVGDPLCGAATKDSSGLLRTVPFTIPAGSTQPLFLPPALQSNVAGTIRIALTNVTMGGQSITVAPLTFTITRQPPQILSTPQAAVSGGSLQLSMKVSTSTCELTNAVATFTPTTGSEFEGAGNGPLTETTDLTGLFKTFTPFAVDATHSTGGCAFMLNLPYNVSGDTSSIASVDLVLSNTVGSAPKVTVVLQQQ